MAVPNTVRFFDFKMARVGAAPLVAGLGFGAYFSNCVINERRISVSGFGFSVFLVLLAGAFFVASFPKGCRACSRRFAQGGTTFPAQNYDQVVAAFKQENPKSLDSLVDVPTGTHEGWTGLDVKYCAGCRGLGEVTVSEQSAAGYSPKYIRDTGAMPLSKAMLNATLDLLQQRPIPETT
ncbi:MAG TPA: hypothetical protein VIV60_26895 [Polyangiaceae bacterium]